ncbi:MAG: ABC transporter ATP-binding protein [Desulfobacteraceae bacterium]|jgi:putative ABC transport system ATP-binding protein
MSFIIIDHITKRYGSGNSEVKALDGISLTIQSGEFVSIMGESGAGKSTLLSVMGAMNTPSEGRYIVDDIDVYGLRNEQQADFRREYLGFVFQSFHLVPYLTVVENVMLPLTAMKLSGRQKEEMAMEAMQWVGLESKAKRLPSQISGGECERVAVARAIVNNPPILLADEPTGNLDSRNTQEVMSLLSRLNASGTTVVMVTHSAACAAFARRTIQVADGRLEIESNKQSTATAAIKAA